jgi:hypothetical protein
LGADIVVTGPDGVIALVEIKNQPSLTRPGAVAVRRNLLTHGLLRPTEFLLIVSQDFAYVWRPGLTSDLDTEPLYEFSMREVLARHFGDSVLNSRLRPEELRTLVFHWLSVLAWSGAEATDSTEASLQRIGFVEAIRRSTLTMETSQ